METEITFPGGLAVEAQFGGFTVRTDQPADAGGGDTAPNPLHLFFASIGTCAGFYALRFCQARKIDTQGLGLTLRVEREGEHGRVAAVRIEVRLPPGFPDKYRAAIVRAVDGCTVKRTIADPPRFEIAVA
ncbi:MAG: OsmC family protein [Myxococcota bacterium]|nr:OsmC family protein [Myxococcota bacterium]